MERVDIWFGDSWTIGSELQSSLTSAEVRTLQKTTIPNLRNNTQNPFLAYPYLVSYHRNATYKNYAVSGGSYEFMYFQMCNWYTKGNFKSENEYTFWLQTTASSRGFGIDYNFKRHHFQGIEGFKTDDLLDFQKTKRSPEFVDYDANIILNAIWHFCQANYIKLRILPLWTGVNLLPELNIVPDGKFFESPNTNMLKNIFGDNVLPDGGVDTADMENEQIIKQIQQYDYIAPNDCHPNKDGHQRIAEYIINKLG